jgi:hypothetical protein
MLSLRCICCEHANPADAKYCNGCGSALRLMRCKRCDAVNDLDATSCRLCRSDLTDTAEIAAHASGGTGGRSELVSSSVARALATIEADVAELANARASPASTKRWLVRVDATPAELLEPSSRSAPVSATPARASVLPSPRGDALQKQHGAAPFPAAEDRAPNRGTPISREASARSRRAILGVALLMVAGGITMYGDEHTTHADGVQPFSLISAATHGTPISNVKASEAATTTPGLTNAMKRSNPGNHRADAGRISANATDDLDAPEVSTQRTAPVPNLELAPYPARAGECSDGIAALGLCSKLGSASGG